MKTRDIKTIDITAKEWFDKVNGNSYFSARLTINFGMVKNCHGLIRLPFQYGYGDQYKWEAVKQMAYVFNLKKIKDLTDIWKTKIILRTNKIEGCRKAEVVEWGR